MYIGVDTHKQTHVLVAIDEDGRVSGSRTVTNTPEGCRGVARSNGSRWRGWWRATTV